MSKKDKMLVPVDDMEAILKCQADFVRSFLEQQDVTANTQQHLSELVCQMAAIYRIFVQNERQPADVNPDELGLLMRTAFGFMQQATSYGADADIVSLLSLWPEWQELTGLTLERARKAQHLAKSLDTPRTNPVPARSN